MGEQRWVRVEGATCPGGREEEEEEMGETGWVRVEGATYQGDVEVGRHGR